jgi:probable phosphoglycerate mutase
VGHEQARRLGVRLAAESVHSLVCSDLLRTQQTALPISQQSLQPLKYNTVLNAALREQHFGAVDGMRVNDIQLQHPLAWKQWIKFQADFAFAGGESTQQFHSRVMAAVRDLALTYAQQTLLVVTHGGVLDMIYRSARGLPLTGPRQTEIPNAGLNRVRIDGAAIEILDWADTQHLADMPAQPSYDQTGLVKLSARLD